MKLCSPGVSVPNQHAASFLEPLGCDWTATRVQVSTSTAETARKEVKLVLHVRLLVFKAI